MTQTLYILSDFIFIVVAWFCCKFTKKNVLNTATVILDFACGLIGLL